MTIKRAFSAVIALALTCMLFVIPVMAGEISLEEQRDAAQGEVNQLQEELSNLMTDMDNLQTQLIATGEQIIQTESELEEAEEDRQQQYEDMMLRIVYIYEAGTVSALERILTAGSIAEMLVQAEFVQTIHNHDREMLTRFVETIESIEVMQTSLEEDLASLEAKKEDYKAYSEVLRVTIETRGAEIADLDFQIAEAARIAAEAAAAAAAAEAAAAEAAAAEAAVEEEVAQAPTPTPSPSPEPAPAPPPTPDPPPAPPPPPADPGGDGSRGAAIVSVAWGAIGVPYVWGGSSMSGFDCSGLTMWAHAQVGISIPRTDITQLNAGRPVPMGSQMPGDIAWTPGHVGLYIGGGQMIEAQQPGTFVMVAPVRASAFVRFW
jgi:cell wall-associated NlpC family hydrolase